MNRYDFAYVRRDVVNQLRKVTPGVIKSASTEINNVAEQRINQIISQAGKGIERVLASILRGAIKDVYQTSFCLLGKLGKQQLQKLKNKIVYVKITFLIYIYNKIKYYFIIISKINR